MQGGKRLPERPLDDHGQAIVHIEIAQGMLVHLRCWIGSDIRREARGLQQHRMHLPPGCIVADRHTRCVEQPLAAMPGQVDDLAAYHKAVGHGDLLAIAGKYHRVEITDPLHHAGHILADHDAFAHPDQPVEHHGQSGYRL